MATLKSSINLIQSLIRIWDLPKYDLAPIRFDTSSATNIILFSPGKTKPALKLFKPMELVPFTITKKRLNMPIWTKEELLQAARLLEFSVTDSTEKAQFIWWNSNATVNPGIHVKFASDEIAKMVYEHLSSEEKDYMMIKYNFQVHFQALKELFFNDSHMIILVMGNLFKFVHLLADQILLRLVAKPHISLQICRKYHHRKDCIADLCEATKNTSIQSCHLI